MRDWVVIAPEDSVAIAVNAVATGSTLPGGGQTLEDIPAGHKVALVDIAAGARVIKYANPIGIAKTAIRRGQWVHEHNLKTGLEGMLEYAWNPREDASATQTEAEMPGFMGYARPDGQVGIRNELWILPGVGCVSHTATRIAQAARQRFADCFTDVVSFTHPFGCSQSGCDAVMTRDLIAALAQNPNAACVLVLGLGCEVNRLSQLMPLMNGAPHIVGFEAQMVEDEVAHALELIAPIAEKARVQQRVPMPLSKLRVGLKCGGSDGYSGLTANPLLGAFCDATAAWGGSCAMSEVPEMFGAEQLLMNRAVSREIFDKLTAMINGYKEYFLRHGEAVYDNPSPGNRDGGITTLEEKSLGCTQKSGGAPVVDVLNYAQRMAQPGLSLVWGPGNDMIACTALAAAGCQLILFTTGRGTPYGGPVPTMKIATNSALAQRKPGWIDFNAGMLLEGVPMARACEELVSAVAAVASGQPARCETYGYREIAIFKDGVIQ